MTSSVGSDGPVLSLLNNCIRALRMQLEEPTSEHKPTIWALIGELEKLREALSSALAQEFRQHSPNELQLEGTSTSQPHHHELERALLCNLSAVIVNNSGHASTLAAIDAASPTLRQIEREVVAEASPITDLLLLACGLLQTASKLLEEAKLKLLPTSVAPVQLHWPSCRVPGFMSKTKSRVKVTPSSMVINDIQQPNNQTPITTLPRRSLLHPRVCPSNVTPRLAKREFKLMHGGGYENRKDRHFVYTRFSPSRFFISGDLYTCITFVGDSPFPFVGNRSLSVIDSFAAGSTKLLLASSPIGVTLDQAWSFGWEKIRFFAGCSAGRFSNSGNAFAALSSGFPRREILVFDIQTCQLVSSFTDTSTGNPIYSRIHFDHSDSILLWNGVFWDRRVCFPVHHFDQITDFGGGGFHPAGNEDIVEGEAFAKFAYLVYNVAFLTDLFVPCQKILYAVWDLRKLRVLRSVPSLHQTTITFNAGGDVIYAILRRNMEHLMSAFYTRRVRHPLFSAFRTVDAVNYSDIATTQVDHCLLDLTTQTTDSFLGLVTMYNNDEYNENGNGRSGALVFETAKMILMAQVTIISLRELDDEDGDFIMDGA
ncbi:DDB1- and CUL4-associated factor-like 1, partial [Mucuna pruriens]